MWGVQKGIATQSHCKAYYWLLTDATLWHCSCDIMAHNRKRVCDNMQKLLSTFKNMDAVQAYDGAQSIASIPGDLHSVIACPSACTYLVHLLTHRLSPQLTHTLSHVANQSSIACQYIVAWCTHITLSNHFLSCTVRSREPRWSPLLRTCFPHNNSPSCAAEMILDSVGKCDVDVRRDLYSGIILTGITPHVQSHCCPWHDPWEVICQLITAVLLCTFFARSMM